MKKKYGFLKLAAALSCYALLLFLLSVAERSSEKANIKSFGDALWYSMVTLTTVGYGDFYPVTPAGRAMALMFIIGSLGLLGFIIGRATEAISEIRWRKKMGLYGTAFENHVVIIGWDSFSQAITRQLTQAASKVAIITDDKDSIELIQNDFSPDQVFTLFADLKNVSTFEKANIAHSSMIFVNLKDDTEKLISLLNVRKMLPAARFIVAVDNADLTETFYTAGASFVLSKNEIASKLMASYIFEPDVADITNDLLTISQRNDDYDIKEFKIVKENTFAGKKFGEVFSALKNKLNVLAIGICKHGKDGKRNIFKLPADDVMVDCGDYLIIIMSGKETEQVKEQFKIGEGTLSCHKS